MSEFFSQGGYAAFVLATVACARAVSSPGPRQRNGLRASSLSRFVSPVGPDIWRTAGSVSA